MTQVKVDIPLDDGNFHTVMLPLENEYPGFQSLKVIIPDNALTKEGSDEEEALEEAESVETEDETIKGQGIEIEIDDLSSNMNNAGEPFIVNELKYQNLATKVIDEILNLELDKVTYSESDYGQTYQAVNEDGSGIYLHKSLANDKGESQINYQSGNTEIYESIALTVNRANEVISLRYENSDGIMAKGGGYYAEIDDFLFYKVVNKAEGGLGTKRTVGHDGVVTVRYGTYMGGMYEIFYMIKYDPTTGAIIEHIDGSANIGEFGNFAPE